MTPRVRSTLIRVAVYSIVLFAVIPLAFSAVLLRTYRSDVVAPPAHGYEALPLRSPDGLQLRAWLRRGDPARPAALIVHGLGDSLDSYVEHAARLHARGHTVLLLDLRGHGGSEGRHGTLGAREPDDLRTGLTRLREAGLAKAGFILWGHSVGAVSVLRAAAGMADVRAVVVEAPFDSYRSTVTHHAWLIYRIPHFVPIPRLAMALAGWRGGFDVDAVDAVAAARGIQAPLLAIADGADERMPPAVVQRVFEARSGPGEMWVCPGADHLGAVLHPEYWSRVTGFLERHGASPAP